MAVFKETKVKYSILVTVTLLFFFIGVIPILFSNWKLISINREELESTLRESFVNTASSVSSQIADYVGGYRQQVREYVPQAYLKVQGSPGDEHAGEPSPLMKDPNILKMRILNTDGKGSYAQKVHFKDPRVADLEYEAFQTALEGEVYVGAPYFDPVENIPILLLAEPLRRPSDEVAGV